MASGPAGVHETATPPWSGVSTARDQGRRPCASGVAYTPSSWSTTGANNGARQYAAEMSSKDCAA
eukprot:4267507-Lingulodinium_polyedra.AAC.1